MQNFARVFEVIFIEALLSKKRVSVIEKQIMESFKFNLRSR